jgi:hypothetical protein
MIKTYYTIGTDGTNTFSSLRAAKRHIWMAYTQEERIKALNGESIYKIVDGEPVTKTKIYVTTDTYFFGKTTKIWKMEKYMH